jgi:sugar-specific transcriptional regulator TrmB
MAIASEDLRALGLTQYESQAFIAMLRIGPSPARKIAEASGVPPTAVYPVLKLLLSKGLVQKLKSENAIFEALDPKRSLRALASREQQAIAAHAERAAEQLGAIPRDPLAPAEPISLSLGIEQSQQIFFEFAENASASLWIMGWKFSTKRNTAEILKTFQRLRKQGVDCRIIASAEITGGNHILRNIMAAGVKVRCLPMENFSIMLSDGKKSKITLKNPSLADRLNLQIHDPDLSKALAEYYEVMWKRAKPVKR